MQFNFTKIMSGPVFQLFATHTLAGLSGLLTYVLLTNNEVVAGLAISGGIIVAGVSGLLLSYNFIAGLRQAGESLSRLVEEVVPLSGKKRRYSLTSLLAQIEILAERIDRVNEVRNQLVRQAGEAAAQEERNRLARDLHDSIKQQIFSISVSAAAVQARFEHDTAGAKVALRDVRQSAQEALVEMKALLQQLRPAPLETVGLLEALRDQAEALGYRSGAQVNTEFGELPPHEQLPVGTQESLFRVAQEALANIARHARASQVKLKLYRREEALYLEIEDNGSGFTLQNHSAGGGMGLANMRERAQVLGGRLEIESSPGTGTTILLTIPLVVPPTPQLLRESREAEAEKLLQTSGNRKWIIGGITIITSALIGALFGYISAGGNFKQFYIWLALSFVLVIALGMGVYSYLSLNRLVQQVVEVAGSDSRAALEARRRSHETNSNSCHIIGLALIIAAFIVLDWNIAIWVGLVALLLFGLPTIQQARKAGQLRQQYLTRLPLDKRYTETRKYAKEGLVRSCCGGIVAVFIGLVYYGLNNSRFPPTNLDEGFALLAVVYFLLWTLIELGRLVFYQGKLKLLERERYLAGVSK